MISIFSTRTRNSLKRAGIMDIKDLYNISPNQLLRYKWIGDKTLKEIEEKIKAIKSGNLDITYPVYRKRDEKILLLRYRDKKTLSEIGRIFNLSRERIRQICNDYKQLFLDLFSKGLDKAMLSNAKDINSLYKEFIKIKEYKNITPYQFNVILYVIGGKNGNNE